MALTNPGLIESAERISQNNNSNGAGYTGGGYYGGGYYGGGYSGSDYSGGGDYSGGNNYNPYANGVPQSVIDAENELNQKSIPNQDYAQQVQDTIIRDQLGYLNDPNYQGTYTSQQTAEAFEYLSRANEGASYTNWAPPKADDQLFTQIVPQWEAAQSIYSKATEQQNAPLPTTEDAIMQSVYKNNNLTAAQHEILNANQIQKGDWNLMSWGDKFKALIVPSSNLEDTVENAPEWAKFVQNLFPAWMASGAGAAIGSVIPIPGAPLIGAAVVGGLTYLQGVTGVKIPVINELLEGMDILSVWAEQGQGAIGATLKETWDRAMEDGSTDLWELGKTMGDVLKDFPDLWEVGQLSYEVGADLGFDNIFNAGRNAVAGASDALFGTDFGQVDTNTVSRANMGIGGLVDVNPETRGYDSLTKVYMPVYRTIRDEAVRQGMSYKDAKKYAISHLSELLVPYMGTTGLANDFAASSVIDPMNFLPAIQAEVADTVGKMTHDESLRAAAKAAKDGASPIVDAFSTPLIQPVVEFVTGKHATQGIDTIMKTYAQELQAKVPAKDLTSFQRRIAGVDDNGLIKNYNKESNPIKRWLGSTDEAKMYNMSENVVNLLGSMLFDTELNLETIPEMISEFVGISPITPDGPLSNFTESALLKTMQSTMGDFTIEDINKLQKRIDNYRSLNQNRAVLDTVAEKLNMKKSDIFDALDDMKRSSELKEKILKQNISITDESGKITLTPEDVYNKIAVFGKDNVGRMQYSEDMLKADILENISRKSQNALLDRYQIKPDSWFNRLSSLGKSVQSIALLNYSPSYFINNFLNNIITRSAVGVGGFDTNSIKTSNEKRGLSYSRGNPAYEETGKRITAKKTKDDLIGKATKKFSDISNPDKLSGKIIKGFNNFDIENLETRAAFDIGANRYWEATWKPGLNIPDLPKELTALGFTPEMNQTIYKLAMDSNNLSEFKQKLAGDVILPGASSTLGQMLQKNYTDASQVRVRNLIDSMPFIRDAVDDILATGNPEAIRAGFQELIDKLTSNIDIGLVQQLSSDFNNLVDRISASGFTEFISSKSAIDDLYNDIWINQSTESEMLFAQRIAANRIPEDQFRPEYEAMLARRNADYAMARKYDVNHLAATIVGLGLKEDIAKTLILNKLQQYDNMQKYITEEHNLFVKFADRTSPDYDYAYYAQSKLDMLQRVQQMQLDSYKQFDEMIIQYLRDNLGKDYTEMIDQYEKHVNDINRYRAELNAKEIEWLQARMDESDLYDRHKISEDQNKERLILKNNIQGQLDDANKTLEILADGFEKPKSNEKVNLTLEQTLWLELLYREANETVANSGEFLEHFIDKSDPKTVFEPSNFSNTNVNESFVDYGKHTSDPEELARIQQAYESGDAVPLGSVDVKNAVMADEMLGNDYKPVSPESDSSVPKSSEVNSDNQVPYSERRPVIESEEDLKKDIEALNKSIDVKNATPEVKRMVKDANEFISKIIDDRTGRTVDNHYFYHEARKSILSDIAEHKPIEAIVINAKNKVIETASRKLYGMLKDELKSSSDKLMALTDSELKAYIDFCLDGLALEFDHEVLGTTKTAETGLDIQEILDKMSVNGKKYAQSIIRKSGRQIDALVYYYNNFKKPLYGDQSDSFYHPSFYYDGEPSELKNQKFDSYEQYAVSMKNNGNELTEAKNNDFLPEKYQSDKYRSELKKSITDLVEQRNNLDIQLNSLKKKQEYVLEKDPFAAKYGEYKKRAESIKRLDLALRVADNKLKTILSHDEYYRNWFNSDRAVKNTVITTDKKNRFTGKTYKEKTTQKAFNYEGLLDDIKNNAKFNPDVRPDSRPGATGEYVKPAQTEKSSINVKEKLDQLRREEKVLTIEKAKLEKKLERLEKNLAKETNKEISEVSNKLISENRNKQFVTIEKHNKDVAEIQRTRADLQHINENLAKILETTRKTFDEQEQSRAQEKTNQTVDQPVKQPFVEPPGPWSQAGVTPDADPITNIINDFEPWKEIDTPPDVIAEIDDVLEKDQKYTQSKNPYEKFQSATEASRSFIDERLDEILDNAKVTKKDKTNLKGILDYTVKTGLLPTETEFYETFLQKHSDIAIDIQTIADYAIDLRRYYKELTGIKDNLKFNRDNLYNIGLRNGYSLEVADAFAEFVTIVANKWNDSHPGKDFFEDAPGVKDMLVRFHENKAEPTTVYGKEGRRPQGMHNYFTRLIDIFGNANDSVLFHEIGHGFQYTLDEPSARVLAKYFGWSYEEYTRLRDKYISGDFSNPNDVNKWMDGAEVFARGFVDYLKNGVAPTKQLSKIFGRFKKFLSGIYRKFKSMLGKESPNEYTPVTDAINNGEKFDVKANDVRNDVSLKQVFDMLVADGTIENPVETNAEVKTNPVVVESVATNPIEITPPWEDAAAPQQINPEPIIEEIDFTPPWEEVELPSEINAEPIQRETNDVSSPVNETTSVIEDTVIADEENATIPTEQIQVDQPQNIPTQPESAKTFSPKPTNQKIDDYIESGLKKIIEANKSENPKLQKISARDMKEVINSIKAEVYNKNGYGIDTSELTGWENVLRNYIDTEASGQKIASEIINFIDQATEFRQQNSTSVDAKREFTPYKSNFKKSDAKFSMVRTQPFYHGDQLVKAGVYHNGEIIAYITTTMPDTISVGGYTFPVIGVDTFDPTALWLYIKDEPVKVTPGKPNGVDYSVFAENGEHPMRYGTTPTTEPWGTAAWETSLPLREALQLWRDEALSQLQTNLDNGSFFGKLTPEQQKALYNWVDGKLGPAYNYQRFASNRYGNTMVDLSMLNYNDRHGFDNSLTAMMPYQYWLTRSALNWGRRMIDQPKWFSTYARLEKLIEKNKRDFLPSRLEGMIGIPMPFLPEGLGQGLYFNPFDIQLPFRQFFNMTEYFDRNLHTIHKNTISIIEEHYREGRPYNGHVITKKEYDDAMLGKGNLYNQVFWDQRNSDETNTGLSGLVSSYFNPNVLVSSLWKAIEAKNSHGKDISYSPMYKLGNTLRASARDTAAEGVFNLLADTLQLPENKWRSMLGVESDSIGSNWSDYWTVKYLTDMLYTKEHSYNDVVNAIAEGESNPLWQEARNRYSTSEAYKQQGGALLNDIMQSMAGNKQTSIGNLAGSALTSLFGGRTFTNGEEDYRRMQELYYQIKDDPAMYQEFWNQIPEYKVGSYAKIDNPEELLHTILVDNCNNAFYALPVTQQNAVQEAFGPQFKELFLDKDTRATDHIDDRLLIEWTRAMHGNIPNISERTINQPLQDAFNVQWYADSVQGLYDRYLNDKKQKFPGIDTIEKGYYNSAIQDQYKAIHPELQKYWNWKESTLMQNPQLATYMGRQTARNRVNAGKYNNIVEAIKGQVNNYTRTCLKNHIEKGWSLPAAAKHQLMVAYTNLGVTIPFDTWLKEIRW